MIVTQFDDISGQEPEVSLSEVPVCWLLLVMCQYFLI